MYLLLGSKLVSLGLMAMFFQVSGLEELATAVSDMITQVMVVGIPVALLAGAAMIAFGGLNPQWKQRGIETIKWTVVGGLLATLGVVAIKAFIANSGGVPVG